MKRGVTITDTIGSGSGADARRFDEGKMVKVEVGRGRG